MSRQRTTADSYPKHDPTSKIVGSRTDKARRRKKAAENHGTVAIRAATIDVSNDARAFGATAELRCLLLGGQRTSALRTVIIPVASVAQQHPFNAAARACSSVCRGPLPLVGNQEEESGDYDFVARGHESGSRSTSFADSAGIPGFRRIPIAGLPSSNTFPHCPIPFLLSSLFLFRARNSFKLAAPFYTFRRSVLCRPRG